MTDVARRLGATSRDEAGFAAVFVAVAVFLIFGAALISVDAGSVWTSRRDLITGTDAAALAAARFFSRSAQAACSGPGQAAGQGEAQLLLAGNNPSSELIEFAVVPSDCAAGAGHVKVGATQPAAAFFAPIFEIDDIEVSSASVAQYGQIVTLTRLRPIGLCAETAHVAEWTASGGNPESPAYRALDGFDDPLTPLYDHPGDDVYPGAGVVHRIGFEKTSDAECGADSPGNWGWLDFNGAALPNGSTALAQWLLNGYPEPVTLGTAAYGDEDCEKDRKGAQDCDANPGAHSSTKKALDRIKCKRAVPTSRCLAFPVIVYDQVSGRGATAEYHHVAFLGVVLRGHKKVTGTPAPDSHFDFEFVDLLWEGTIGIGPSGIPGVRGIGLCGIDSDTAEHRCDV